MVPDISGISNLLGILRLNIEMEIISIVIYLERPFFGEISTLKPLMIDNRLHYVKDCIVWSSVLRSFGLSQGI
jgi:hypothetical protein